MSNILITGACGQIGSELLVALAARPSTNLLVASDIRDPLPYFSDYAIYEKLDITDATRLQQLVLDHRINTIFHMASILSAKGEQNPQLAYNINLQGLFNVLEVARQNGVSRVISPSTIAVFGPDAPKENTPNETPLNPTTMYGVTKVAGEKLMQYYHLKYGLDCRSLRYPGIISSATLPGGGTTDYAVDMYLHAARRQPYVCFIDQHTPLPFMYMPDAIKAIIDLAGTEKSRLKRQVYNVHAITLTPADIAASISAEVPGFSCSYEPDYRQAIAASWPYSIDDRAARAEWGWQPAYDLPAMTADMLSHLKATV